MKVSRLGNLVFRQKRYWSSNPTKPISTSPIPPKIIPQESERSFNPEILREAIIKKEKEKEKTLNPQDITLPQESIIIESSDRTLIPNQTIQNDTISQEQPQESSERTLDPDLLREVILKKDNQLEEFDRSNKVILEKLDDVGTLDILPGHENLVNGFNAKYFNVGTVAVFGSVLIFPDAFFIWRVKDVYEITIESLAIFEIYSPPPSLVIIGTGHRRREVDGDVIEYFSKKGISLEPYSSADAAATLNFLLQEGRNVAGALISIGERYNDQFRR